MGSENKPSYKDIFYSLWYVVAGFVIGVGMMQKSIILIFGGVALFLIFMVNDSRSYSK